MNRDTNETDGQLKKRRVIGTLTTMPDRYDKILKTLKSLNNQKYKLDEIYLGIPLISKRLNIPYPPIPEEIIKLCTIIRCDDYGPITKIVGGLLSEKHPDTVIISFDDDMIYPDGMVEKLMSYHEKYPNSAIGSSGMLLRYNCPFCAITPNENNLIYNIPKFYIPSNGRLVDSLYGYPGALYVRKFFPSNKDLEATFLSYALIDNNTFMNDDITISGYLSLNNIDRRIFPDFPTVSFVTPDNSNTRVRSHNEISYDLGVFFQRMNGAISTCKSLGMYETTQAVDISETIAGVSTIIIICVVILLIVVIVLIFFPSLFSSADQYFRLY